MTIEEIRLQCLSRAAAKFHGQDVPPGMIIQLAAKFEEYVVFGEKKDGD